MYNTKFKVGDRVVALRSEIDYYTKDKIYEVVSIYTFGDYERYASILNNYGDYWIILDVCFKLLDIAPAQSEHDELYLRLKHNEVKLTIEHPEYLSHPQIIQIQDKVREYTKKISQRKKPELTFNIMYRFAEELRSIKSMSGYTISSAGSHTYISLKSSGKRIAIIS